MKQVVEKPRGEHEAHMHGAHRVEVLGGIVCAGSAAGTPCRCAEGGAHPECRQQEVKRGRERSRRGGKCECLCVRVSMHVHVHV